MLRGAAGDLKTSGTIRIYLGQQDQAPDPLIVSDEGDVCPGFRDCAYVVLEDLDLGDFGNRIPALTFEVHADATRSVALNDMLPAEITAEDGEAFAYLSGFTDDGGSFASTLGVLDRVFPLTSTTTNETLNVKQDSSGLTDLVQLPERLISEEERKSEPNRTRPFSGQSEPTALRYYDTARDYQPGVQRAIGRRGEGREEIFELPAALSPNDARDLCNGLLHRRRAHSERLDWRLAELDPTLTPGAIVSVPGYPGHWKITDWEWADSGVNLSLQRSWLEDGGGLAGAPGKVIPPGDFQPAPSRLRAFELPWDGYGDPNIRSVHAAVSSEDSNWVGTSLYVDRSGALEPLELSTRLRSVMGRLGDPLGSSDAMYLERGSSIRIDHVGAELSSKNSTIAGLSAGENRILVGGEIVQFLTAEQSAENSWILSGLLRGRGGTEHLAMATHPAGTEVTLLDDTLISLSDAANTMNATTQVAAIGSGDEEPVMADLEHSGRSRRPLAPVHTKVSIDDVGDWSLSWKRRARGQWVWLDHVGVPLIEETELHHVGVGDSDAPANLWETDSSSLVLNASAIALLTTTNAGDPLWVAQVGTFGRSPATQIATIP